MKVFPARVLPVLAVGLLLTAAPARADVVDRALVRNAADIAKAVRENLKDRKGQPAEYVAVLKFEVQVGNRPASFDAGLANTQLAQKLENLLVLTYNPDDGSPAVLTGAAAKAAKTLPPGTTWKDEAGREKLATLKGLPFAWDKDQDNNIPDAFVTGTLFVTANLQSARVVLHGFTRDNPADLKKLYTTPEQAAGEPPAIPTDRSLLSMVGATFAVVDRNLDRVSGDREAVKDALAGLTQPSEFVQRLAVAPVKLDVLINGEPVEPETDPANPTAGRIARGADPKKGDKLVFRLRNTSKTRSYAVLLAVNGKNTNALSGDHLNAKPPKDHRLWVLGPDEKVDIPGFYTTQGGEFQEFRILGESESEAVYPLMGEQYRGLITMHVFGEKTAVAAKPVANGPPPKPADDPPPARPAESAQAEAEVTLLSLGVGGDALEEVRTAGSPEEARKKIQSLTNVSTRPDGRLGVNMLKATTLDRGLIVPSESQKNGGPIETVKFTLDPNVLAFVQVRYYGR